MSRFQLLILLSGIIVIISATAIWQFRSDSQQFYASVTEALSTGSSLDQFDRALVVKKIEFPKDLGPHNRFQTEWWYYTGNLTDDEGRHFGYQLTFFRRAISPESQIRPSAWATNQIYFAHFAVTDTANKKFYAFERFSRGSLGLAGAQASPYKVWLENWHVEEKEELVELHAAESGISIRIYLKSEKSPVLQGDRGLSQKSAEPGNASYYYSKTRLHSQGQIEIQSIRYDVSGFSWLDREWSTSALSKHESGWDWFALQLSDNRELMLFQIRQGEGKTSPFSGGSLVLANGETIKIRQNDFTIYVTRRWKSPITGIIYPAGWKIVIPEHELNLVLKPQLADQEHRHSFAYWEGAVMVKDAEVSGSGYVELTGYQ